MATGIYHFTHIENLPSILRMGELRCDNAVRDAGCLTVEVGNRDIKDRRRTRAVPCGPGGVVADYVPFYFAPRSPMLYSINRGNVPEYPQGQSPLVYLVSSVEQVAASDAPIVFTDGNAGHALSEFFANPELLGERIDWEIMQATMWNNTAADGDRMRRRMAEALVYQCFPAQTIQAIACIDEDRADSVAALCKDAGSRVEVRVERGWYF